MSNTKTPPNGSATPSEDTSKNNLPPIVGINFGNSFASIAVFTKEGVAECIANEDGERQIAAAISFSGEEIYYGNQATQQLVKNSSNTIVGFRNLLGKKFSEISQSEQPKSAPVIQHPEIADEPAYKVEILQPAPTPLPTSTHTSNLNTPAASHAATPRSEPTPATRILTVSEVTSLFLGSLLTSASDFLGKPIAGAVITVPPSFSATQKSALIAAAENAGVKVLQLLDEAAAVAAVATREDWGLEGADREVLVVDLGASSLSLSLLSLRDGLAHILASSNTPTPTSNEIDDVLIKFFAADFTKKTKIPLLVATQAEQSVADKRAEARLRLAIEHTKRTISASSGPATVSVESLKDGVDYTGAINRMRFDLLARPIYSSVVTAVTSLLSSVELDAHAVHEIVYVGGSASLPGLDEALVLGAVFAEDVATPFARGVVVGGGVGDPTTVLARGAAVQGALVASVPADDEAYAAIRGAYSHAHDGEQVSSANEVIATSKTLGILLPGPEAEEGAALGGTWIQVVAKDTPLPARRAVRFDVAVAANAKAVAVEVWEVSESIRVEKVVVPAAPAEDDEDEEEPEEEEIKHRVVHKDSLLGVVQLTSAVAIQAKGNWTTTLEVVFVVDANSQLKVQVQEIGEGGAQGVLKTGA
ncbi:hypothetical protein DXG03_000509 [Asterophora parasitica]|uniref:Actin-like ATPase domain-containing protein n=1 Tax=Asterophora parasitica TaxID=117018 RepID=A0A9P7K9Q0_9AGAR|nr:hypothetical protein DXG03_000509 [Asterophora parasitica]